MKGNAYYWRKLHSLFGVIPLGGFILVHVSINFQAFERGPEGFATYVKFINSLPLKPLLEILGIYLPILFHGVYGLYMAYRSNMNAGQYAYGRNWAFILQRMTGVVTFIFVFWHFFNTRLQVYMGTITHEDLGSTMHRIASNPAYFILYVIGVLSAVFHFSNGLWAFLISWGVTISPRSQKISSYVCMGIFAVVSLLFILSLVAFTGEEFSA
ncbi:succinate dehydrogenase cytochrome b558 subunit [Paenibacillus sacheonensis]|uniref:Succinate dehydrogenase n=1 Tax=Paenibacillus sacheonensis TaxID=742054 RepID=A0A7X5C0Q9_9BACL|nr:succinate dehydrogenase cytochrome b558 subunit [Paenibacillus sacheonensis]MBM7566062.1 succinate dehydrogenase / fumarate reductase cytochrome b subunit [Paenibacillus sacheonensis]NBC68629.1 succinate dehydrogenase [Paenibacillus sacheonensis]